MTALDAKWHTRVGADDPQARHIGRHVEHGVTAAASFKQFTLTARRDADRVGTARVVCLHGERWGSHGKDLYEFAQLLFKDGKTRIPNPSSGIRHPSIRKSGNPLRILGYADPWIVGSADSRIIGSGISD